MGERRGTRLALPALVALVAALAVPGVSSAAVPATPGVVYGAETRQFEVVTIEVNAARNRVTKLHFGWGADCTPGPAATPTTPTFIGFYEYRGGFPINRQGVWSRTVSESGVEGTNTFRFVYTMRGVRTVARINGTLRVQVTETDAAGQIVRSCDTKPIAYAAVERSRFGGLTIGYKAPILIQTNPAVTRIQRVRWDWIATCVAGPAAKPETQLETFQPDFIAGPIVIKPNKTFSKSFTYQPAADAASGVTRAYTAKVSGSVVGRTIRGAVEGGFTETDTATGQVIRTCQGVSRKFNTKD